MNMYINRLNGCYRVRLSRTQVYDFSLMVGDTFFVPSPLSSGIGELEFYLISDIDTILFGNTLRKKFSFTGTGTIPESSFWIEGIGGGCGPFMSHYVFESWSVLRCFNHNDELLYSEPFPWPPQYLLEQYSWYSYCDTSVVGIVDVKKPIRPITLFAHGSEVRIPDFGSGTSQYTIYSVLGQQQMDGNVTNGILQLPYMPTASLVLK